MRKKFSSVKAPTSRDPGMNRRKLYCRTSGMAARKTTATRTEGTRKAANKGLLRIGNTGRRRHRAGSPRSVHHVLGEPRLPFGQQLRPRLVVDRDRLALPLLGRREDAGQLGDLRVELRLHAHRGALVQLAEFLLNNRIERHVDELVRGGKMFRPLVDAERIDADDRALFRNLDLDRKTERDEVIAVDRQEDLNRSLAVLDQVLTRRIGLVEGLDVGLEFFQQRNAGLPARRVAAR